MGYSGPHSLGWHKAVFGSNTGPMFARFYISRTALGKACYCKLTGPLRHVVSFGLNRDMLWLFRATECKVGCKVSFRSNII